MKLETNEKWECYLCVQDYHFEELPAGYLSNSHPLCLQCANSVLNDVKHKHRFRLTYHKKIGDLKLVSNVFVQYGYPKLN